MKEFLNKFYSLLIAAGLIFSVVLLYTGIKSRSESKKIEREKRKTDSVILYENKVRDSLKNEMMSLFEERNAIYFRFKQYRDSIEFVEITRSILNKKLKNEKKFIENFSSDSRLRFRDSVKRANNIK